MKQSLKRIWTVAAAGICLAGSLQGALAPARAIPLVAGPGSITLYDTVVGMGGTQWYVIGYQGAGVNPQADEVTLLAKEAVFGTTEFDDLNSIYQGSRLQGKMEEIYRDAFAEGERERIIPRPVLIDVATDTSATWGELAGEHYVWPLSQTESLGSGIPAAQLQYDGGSWWTRSPGLFDITSAGCIDQYGWPTDVHVTASRAVRPALNYSLASVLFASAAEGGKASAAVGNGLAGVQAPTGPIKFTMEDSGMATPDLTLEEGTNGSKAIWFDFSGAETGSNLYLSCVLEQGGAVTHYAKLADCATEGSGSFELPVGGLAAGTYLLKIFSEQANGDNQTDFAGPSLSVDLTVDSDGNGRAAGVRPTPSKAGPTSGGPARAYQLRVLPDPAGSGLKVSGWFRHGVDVEVTDQAPHGDGCAACAAMAKEGQAGNVLARYALSVKANGYEGDEVTVTVPMAKDYEGRTLTLLYCHKGSLGRKTVTVEDGLLTAELPGLDFFAILRPAG